MMLKCKICGKKFLITSNYEVHLKVFHEQKPKSIDTFAQNGDSKEGVLGAENSSLCSPVRELQELKKEVTNQLDTSDFTFCPVKVEKEDVSVEDGLVTCKSEPTEDTDFDVTFGKSAPSCSGPLGSLADSDGTIPYCDESTKSQIKTEVLPLESPGQSVETTAAKNDRCPNCNMQFLTARAAYYHWVYNHSHDSADWPWTCLKCGKRSTSKSTLRRHMVGTHGEVKRKFVALKPGRECLICGVKVSNMNKHLGLVHSVPNQSHHTKCDFCEAVFETTRSKSVHMRDCDQSTIAYNCAVCDEKFTKFSSRYRHMRTQHQSQQAE